MYNSSTHFTSVFVLPRFNLLVLQLCPACILRNAARKRSTIGQRPGSGCRPDEQGRGQRCRAKGLFSSTQSQVVASDPKRKLLQFSVSVYPAETMAASTQQGLRLSSTQPPRELTDDQLRHFADHVRPAQPLAFNDDA